jgi:hypothetical protein
VIASTYVGVMILIAAAALGMLERCMGPDMRRFPCVNGRTILVLQIYTLFLALAAYGRLARTLYYGDPPDTTAEQIGASTAMAFAHISLAVVVFKLRLNEGVWPRLQARWRRVHNLNKLGSKAGATLAKQAAMRDDLVVTPQHLSPVLADPELLDRLADRP